MIRFDLVGARVRLAADPEDRDALLRLGEQFTALLAERDRSADSSPPDPALARLFPDPVPDDPAESAEVRALTLPALVDHKRANAQRVAASLTSPGVLDERDELAWLQWLTDVRIVLASRLGIVVDGDEGASATDAQRAMQWTYHALGSLQGDLLDVLDERIAARSGDEEPS